MIAAVGGRLLLLRAWKISTDLVMSIELIVMVWIPLVLLTAVPDCTNWSTAAEASRAGRTASKAARHTPAIGRARTVKWRGITPVWCARRQPAVFQAGLPSLND